MPRLSVKEAAAYYRCSEATIRRRIRDGVLHAVKHPIPGGFEWLVEAPDQGDDQLPITDDLHSGRGSHYSTGDHPSPPDEEGITIDDHLSVNDDPLIIIDAYRALLDAHERLQQQNVQLAGRIGWLESQLQQAQEQIRLLTTEKEPTVQPIEETAPASAMQQHEKMPQPMRTRQGRILRGLLRRLGIG